VLNELNIPLLVIDLDPAAISVLRSRGIPCIYGDAGNREVLREAALENAGLLLIAIADPASARRALDYALEINPDLEVVARVHTNAELDFLKGKGASGLVQPEYEASIELTRHVLCRRGVGEEKALDLVGKLRKTCPVRQSIWD
jgi:CPA2 family monovalent cation:H+ antiporter-2